jgi:hypothetical protein
MAGSFGRIKTVNKSKHWHKHGKHASALYKIRGLEQQAPKKPQPEMFPSVAEALASTKRRRKK